MSDCLFRTLFAAIILVDGAYVVWFVYGAVKHDMLWISMESTQMYTEVAKAVIVGAGIVASVLAAGMSQNEKALPVIRPMLAYLAVSIVFAVFLIMILSRATETAIGRELRKRKADNLPTNASEPIQGHLNWFEFVIAMICTAISLAAFMLGILYLTKLGYI
jgi:hypothetical protein